VGGFRFGVLCNNLSSLSAIGARGLDGLRFSAPLRRFGLGAAGDVVAVGRPRQ
jgi:hypothetical protein